MKVSVCIATCNGENYIKEQVDSILCQIGEQDEIIISDDSSSDNTVKILKNIPDPRLKIIENQRFRSPIFNFENSLMHASGEIIVLSDQDDIWEPNKIRIIKKYLNQYDLVLSDAYIIDENGEITQNSFYKLYGSGNGLVKNLIKNSFLGCTMAFNRKIYLKSLPFPKDIPMHDWWIGLIGELYGKTFFIQDKLISYRRHGNNASPTGGKSQYSLIKKVSFRFVMCKRLFLRYFRFS